MQSGTFFKSGPVPPEIQSRPSKADWGRMTGNSEVIHLAGKRAMRASATVVVYLRRARIEVVAVHVPHASDMGSETGTL